MHTAENNHEHLASGVDFRYGSGADPHLIVPERETAARRARIAQRNALEELWHQVVEAHSIVSH